jgi:hypothetical protein
VSFVEQFFGPGNAIRWRDYQTAAPASAVRQRLQPFIDELSRNPDVCVLPRVSGNNVVQWYVLCRTARVQRLAKEEISGFVGPTYSDFGGQPAPLDSADPIDSAVLQHWGQHSFRIEVPSSAESIVKERIRERLLLWTRMRRERPERAGSRVRATGRILRDFEYAVSAADGETAQACIAELRSFGRLDARNLQFLEVRRLASLNRWHDLRGLPEFDSLLAIRRPLRVTEAIITCVYITELQRFELNGDVEGALRHFRDEVLPRFSDLYRSRRGLAGEHVVASFVLAAATADPPRPDSVSAIIDGFGGPQSRQLWLDKILIATRTLSVPREIADAPTLSLSTAIAAFAAGDLDRAIELAVSLPESVDQAGLLLRCAHEVGTIELAHIAVNAVDRLSSREQDELQANPRLWRVYDELVQLLGKAADAGRVSNEPAVESWTDWLRRLTNTNPWPSAVATAELGAREWAIDACTDPIHATELANLINASRPHWGDDALRNASPHFIDAILDDGPRASLQPAYDALLLLLLTDPNPSLAALQVIIRLTQARLVFAITVDEYRELLDGVGSVIDQLSSPAACEVALDALEALINVPSPDRVALQGMVSRLVRMFARWHRHVDPLQRKLLGAIAAEIGMPEMVELPSPESGDSEPDDLCETLQGLSIGMYSLNERALTRAAKIVGELCPNVVVATFHDQVGGAPALRAAAAKSDVFVLAVAAAKHSATDYIAQNRPKQRLTVYARGQGSTGLISALKENVDAIKRAMTRH